MGAAYKSLCTAALIQMLLGLGYSQYQTWESTRLHCMFLTFCPTCESFGFSSFFRVSIKESSVAKLGSVCRRIYRIFSHAYFHHRQIFDEYEVSICLSLLNISVLKTMTKNSLERKGFIATYNS
jgi:hypothetical protein